jgi:hypothetical protein
MTHLEKVTLIEISWDEKKDVGYKSRAEKIPKLTLKKANPIGIPFEIEYLNHHRIEPKQIEINLTEYLEKARINSELIEKEKIKYLGILFGESKKTYLNTGRHTFSVKRIPAYFYHLSE